MQVSILSSDSDGDSDNDGGGDDGSRNPMIGGLSRADQKKLEEETDSEQLSKFQFSSSLNFG